LRSGCALGCARTIRLDEKKERQTMTNDLVLMPLGKGGADARYLAQVVRIDVTSGKQSGLGMWCDKDGTLRVSPLDGHGRSSGKPTKRRSSRGRKGPRLAVTVKCVLEDSSAAWYGVPQTTDVGVNSLGRPFPLFRLEPGTLFSVGQHCWWVTEAWQLKPQPAPPEIAESPCPVCGSKLSVAPVVHCPGQNCGRWTHLEQPGSEEALNCYLLSDKCGGCLHPTTLEPVLVPEPPEQLFPSSDEYLDVLDTDE